MRTYKELSLMGNAEIEKEPCMCVSCPTCRGTGTIRVDMLTGGPDPGDDMYELDPCSECHSRGIVEICDRCRLLEEFDLENE